MAIQSFRPVVLLTRPQGQSARFAESLHARAPGMRIVTSALLEPVLLNPVLGGGPWAAVILTSQTGAEVAGRIKAVLPDLAFCVGLKTGEAAREAGFTPIVSDGDAEALLALILSHPKAPLLHLRGREARGDLARRLSASGLPAEEVVVYAQDPRPLTPEAVALLQGPAPVIVPLFSPRSAEILAAECHRVAATAPLILIAMSGAVARAADFPGHPMQIVAHPDGTNMVEAVLAHWSQASALE
jgi:uroporphyrinogen-III synthase